ncbi:MAG: trehalose-phosphatase, partial [Deltaproteobacteria bacterium]|nr:trehalose-phosphatase [Deltaproteobacteria bacterium]
MKILTDRTDLESFWKRLRQAQQALLLLDFDGTLAPFVADPAEARLYPGVAVLLQKLMLLKNNRLVIVSGREINSLSACLELETLPELWGCHGWQRCLPGGRALQRRLPGHIAEILERAAELARDSGYAAQLEVKPVSLALHWRGLEPEAADVMREQLGGCWQQLANENGLQLTAFDGGLELRGSELDKGTAVTQLLGELDENDSVAYLGDDLTDEDAFAALAERGL